MPSKVDHPDHYNVGDIETIEYLESLGIAEPFCIGNAIKYLSRYKHKGEALNDLEKAQWYLNRAVSYYQEKEQADLLEALRDELNFITFHTCGLMGFNPLIGDTCEMCEREKRAKYEWSYSIPNIQDGQN